LVCVTKGSTEYFFERALLIWSTSTSYDHKRVFILGQIEY